jgi:caa(3)-type oxidase subunit IV
MRTILRSRVTVVWLALSVLTVVSWILGVEHGTADHVACIVIIAVATFKIRLVAAYFMELNDAPQPLRAGFEIYCLAVLLVLTGTYPLA